MTTQNKNVPALRFAEFSEDWEKKRLKEVCNKVLDGTHFSPKSTEGTRKYLTSKNIRNGGLDFSNVNYISEEEHKSIYKRCPVKFGDVLLTKDGANTGNCCINTLKEEFSLLSSVAVLDGKADLLDNVFLLQVLQSANGINTINNVMAGQAISRITLEKINNFKFLFPTLPEQQKIAAFLTAVDEKVQQLAKKKHLMEQYKKGVMQKIFNQEIRFKDDNGNDFADWEEKPLSNFLFETRKRNGELKYTKQQVLSVSGEAGIVNQIQHMGRSYAGESVHNYHIVETGDIVYTKSPLKSNPYGIVKVNKGVAGIVSTLYAVYSCKENIIGEFIDYYFEIDDNTNKYLRPLVRKGAKNDMKINNAHVLTGLISIPSIPEQRKIIDFFEAMNRKINSVNQQLEKTKEYKKGLLQQMFV